MGQTKEGAIKTFCKLQKIDLSTYYSKTNNGLKWCVGCKDWHNIQNFGKDKSRYDGLSSTCLKYRRLTYNNNYIKKTTRKKGYRIAKVRDGDKKQARHRVNHLVEIGLLPNPNKLPCSDCDHIYKKGGKRHEYDHYLGYSGQHHEVVEVVCSTCHHKRERGRNGNN